MWRGRPSRSATRACGCSSAPCSRSRRRGPVRRAGPALAGHFRRVADPLVTLTLAAAATERVRLGTVSWSPRCTRRSSWPGARRRWTRRAAAGWSPGLGTGWSLRRVRRGGRRAVRGARPGAGRVRSTCARPCGARTRSSYEGRRTKIAPLRRRAQARPADPGPAGRRQRKKALTRLVRPRRRLAARSPWAPTSVAATWAQVAGHGGRARPARSRSRPSVAVNGVQYTAKAYDGGDRAPAQGSVDQIVDGPRGAHAARRPRVLPRRPGGSRGMPRNSSMRPREVLAAARGGRDLTAASSQVGRARSGSRSRPDSRSVLGQFDRRDLVVDVARARVGRVGARRRSGA